MRKPAAPFRLLLLLFLAIPAHPAFPAGERAIVREVQDGDTVLVRTGGSDLPVRLIGIDAPEKGHPERPPEFLGAEAASRLASLCEGKEVLLVPDREDRDRYGRLLRYLILPGTPGDGGAVTANLEMVREGLARVLRRHPFSRRAEFEKAEAEAKRLGRGIWGEAGGAELAWILGRGALPVEVYPAGGRRFAVVHGGMGRSGVAPSELGRVAERLIRLRAGNSDPDFRAEARREGFLPAVRAGVPDAPPRTAGRGDGTAPDRPRGAVSWEEAHRHTGEEVVVEGRIVRTHRSRDRLFLNFHPNWRKYVTVVVPAEELSRFPEDPERHYGGREVRVTGTVTTYEGRPEIVVRDPSRIRVVR